MESEGLERKDTAHVQVKEGNQLRQEIIKVRILTIEEADKEITAKYKEK